MMPRASPSYYCNPPGTQVKVCVIDTGARRTHQDHGNIAGGWNR